MKTVANNINQVLKDIDSYPNSAMVRLPVVKGLLGVSGATIWRMCQANKLRSYKLTERTTTFNLGEIRALIATKAGV